MPAPLQFLFRVATVRAILPGRSLGAVVEDFATAGDSIFVADDLFWNPTERSLELAGALRKRGVKKRWILVQTRTDMICRQQELLEAWRPLAKDFDIFLGLEAATDAGLSRVDKDVPVSESVEAVRIARSLRYGVNGNFLVDPDWGEEDFLRLWEFVACHGLQRAGYTNTLYAPPNHRDGVVHHTRADAEADNEHFDGKTTE